MDELRETSIHHTALKFSEDIKQMKVYNNLFKTVQVCMCFEAVRPSCVKWVFEQIFPEQEISLKSALFPFLEIGMLARSL